MRLEALRFAVMTHPIAGQVFLEQLLASKLKPSVVVTQDPFFVPHDSRLRPLRWVKRRYRYALHRRRIQQRHAAYCIAKQHHIPTFPAQIANTQRAARALQSLDLDYIFVFGFPMLKAMIYTIPRHGAINCHPAYLPSHRGRDPIFWTLKHRDAYTGVTFHYIDAGIDTGKVIARRQIPLCEFDDACVTAHRVLSIGARQFVDLIYRFALELPIDNVVETDVTASYDRPAQRSDRYLHDDLSADAIVAMVRASRGHGNAWLTMDERDVEVIDAIALPGPPADIHCPQRTTFDRLHNIVRRCADGRWLYLITKSE